MGLSEKTCIPCRGGVPPLTADEIKPLASQVKQWNVVSNHHVEKEFKFPDFKSALNFVNRVVAAADTPSSASPGDFVDYLTRTLLDGQVSPDQRQVLVDYLTPSSGQAANRTWLDERRRGALYLALAMPEYHLS